MNWAEVRDAVKAQKGQLELLNPALVKGSFEQQVDVMARNMELKVPEGIVDAVVGARVQLELLAPLAPAIVAGLQAVATARRLGAMVKVSDVRPAAREQVESLGGRFIEPPQLDEAPGEVGGYAREAGAVFLEAQRQLLAPHLQEADVVITTAQVPGKPAPVPTSSTCGPRTKG